MHVPTRVYETMTFIYYLYTCIWIDRPTINIPVIHVQKEITLLRCDSLVPEKFLKLGDEDLFIRGSHRAKLPQELRIDVHVDIHPYIIYWSNVRIKYGF